MFNDTHLSEAGKLLGKVHVARIPNNLIDFCCFLFKSADQHWGHIRNNTLKKKKFCVRKMVCLRNIQKNKQTVIKGNGSKTLYGQSLFLFKCFTIVRPNYKLIKLISILKSFFFGQLTD